MSFRVCLTHSAQADLTEIFRHIAFDLQSPQNATGQLKRLENAVSKLDEMPERYRIYNKEPWSSRNLRVMPVDHYLVFYIPNRGNNTVTVIRILYGGREPDRHLSSK